MSETTTGLTKLPYEEAMARLVVYLRSEDDARPHLVASRAKAKKRIQGLAAELGALADRIESIAVSPWIESWEARDQTLASMRAARAFLESEAKLLTPTKARPMRDTIAFMFLGLRQMHGKSITLSENGPVTTEFAQIHAAAGNEIDNSRAYKLLRAAKAKMARE